MKNKVLFIWIVMLIMLDQLSKIIIDNFFVKVNMSIIPGLVYFKPHLNTDYSWINSLFNFGVGFWGHLIPAIIIFILMIVTFDYIYFNGYNSIITDFIFVFFISGTLCSIIDKVFWGGSLDFIYLKSLFIFDLKDCYISLGGEVIAFYAIIKYWDKVKDFKIKHLVQHCKKRLLMMR